MNNRVISEDISSLQKEDDVQSLYDKIMGSFTKEDIEQSSTMIDGYYCALYATGYDNNGISDISANCL